MNTLRIITTLFWLILLNMSLAAQEQQKESLDEIAKQMSNPTLPMFNLSTFYDYQHMAGDLPGASSQNVHLFALQPPLPFPMKNGKNLLVRPLISFLFSQPVYKEDGFESAGGIQLGDIPVDILYAGTSETGFMSGFGMIANIPLSTSSDIRGEWRLGPSFLIGSIKKNVFVLVLNNGFDLSGDNKQSVLGGQYVAAFSLKGGWQIVASPPFSYNWNTKQLTLPIGGGPFRTVMMGKTAVKMGLQINYYISQPDPFGPKWGMRINVTPRLKRPW